MNEYHKIPTVFKRNPATKYKTLLMGFYAEAAFLYLARNDWVFTEKVDGTNIRVMWDGEAVTFGGKTDNAQIPARLVNALSQQFDTTPARKRLAEVLPDGGCLYGEGYGAKIQKGGGNYRQDQGFVLFDVRVGDWWLQSEDVIDVSTRLGIDKVPVVGIGTLADMVAKAQNGFVSQWGDFPAEGIVARPVVELQTRAGARIITKIKAKDFPSER